MIDYIQDMWTLSQEGEKQGILFFVSIYALLLCSYSLAQQYLIRRWPVAKGNLLNCSISRWGLTERLRADQDYTSDANYQYFVNGKEYTGYKVSPWIIIASHNAMFILKKQLKRLKIHSDGSVDVYYNPRRPEKSFLVLPGYWGMFVTLSLALLPLLFYLYEYL